MDQLDFNQIFQDRTKRLAVSIIKMYAHIPKNDETRILGKQLIRSSTSVAANYRAACRARSDKEKFSKLSIVAEEADETLFWLEILEESGIIKFDISKYKAEITEILKVMSKARNSLRTKLRRN